MHLTCLSIGVHYCHSNLPKPLQSQGVKITPLQHDIRTSCVGSPDVIQMSGGLTVSINIAFSADSEFC